MTSLSLDVRLTALRCGVAVVILMTSLSCDSIGPEPQPVPSVPAVPSTPTPPSTPGAPTVPEVPESAMVPIMPGEIVFLDPNENAILVADSTGQRLRRVRGTSGARDLAVSPDGTSMAFSRPGPCYSLCSSIYILTADAREPFLLRTGDAYDFPVNPAWSPDGKRLAFVQRAIGDDGWRAGHIYTINVDGTGITQLTHSGHNASPDWSPDGKTIVFAHIDRATGWQIFEMDRDGLDVRRLGSGQSTFDEQPKWSPDGSRIAFYRSGADDGLFVMNADGSNVRMLKSGLGYSERPAWSPDGKNITFVVPSAARMFDEDINQCCNSAKLVGLDGVVDLTWELPLASYLVWHR